MISYAQNFEDVILWRALKSIPVGHYVDVGAFHPEIDSVTKWFYDQGWCGINLEPVPEMFAVLTAARPRDTNLQVAAADFSGEAEMAVVPDSMGLSSLDILGIEANVSLPHSLIKLPVRPLRDILELYAWPEIHFLKIDAEGTEEVVLRGMDFGRFRPWIVVIEATIPMTDIRASEKCHELLMEQAYSRVYFDGLNDFYVAAEHMELAVQLDRPPNVFDQFELAATVRERHGREELAAVSESFRSQVAERDGALVTLRDELAAVSESFRSQVAERDGALVTLRDELASAKAEVVRLGEAFSTAQTNIADLNQRLAVSGTDIDTLRAQLATLRRSHVKLQEDHAAVQQHNLRLRSDLDTSEKSIVQLSADLAELAAGLRHDRETSAALEQQLQQVLNSRSFRWLAPARRLRAVLLPHR